MRRISALSLAFCAACGVAQDPSQTKTQTQTQASASTASVKTDSGTVTSSSAALTAGGGVTRHLPGTLITTATGKYYYLVNSDGTIAPFATASVATASGYRLEQAIIVTTGELACYGRADQITAPISSSGNLLADGVLAKERGRSAVYAVSDGVAWPILNQSVFDLAGYDLANVVEVSAGALSTAVAAIGDCVIGIACLDEAYLFSCAENDAVNAVPVGSGTVTATSTATQSQTVSNGLVATQRAGEGILRHLPGTVITTGSGKYYLVNDDDTVSPFLSPDLVMASGYAANMVIIVSSEEFGCYGLGDQITQPLQAPLNGNLRDGTIVKEKSRKDVYVISGGIAWPVITGTVFEAVGYTFDATVFLADGGLAGAVDGIGDCAQGFFCLTDAYGRVCAGAGEGTAVTATAVSTATKTASSTATQTNVETTDVAAGTATKTATGSSGDTLTQSTTETRTATATQAQPTATATATTVGTGTMTSTQTQTQASVPQSAVPDLSWVYEARGSDLCLNAAYFAGDSRAVLLIWDGPGADALAGPVAIVDAGRFCWGFANREKGLYRFWADVPSPDCTADICPRDSVPGNGAMYMTAPKASAAAKKWLYCETSGCDGMAYWDGLSLMPAGG